MNLFINAVSPSWVLICFWDDKRVLNSKSIEVAWNESSRLTSFLDAFVEDSSLEYKNINNIVVVSWPWSFTWVRAISLIVNTIAFTGDAKLTDISFFDLFETYPVVKPSSKRDLFVKYSKKDKIEVVKNEDFLEYLKLNKITKIYWDFNRELLDDKINIINDINYDKIIPNIVLRDKKSIEPLYIKKPSIS